MKELVFHRHFMPMLERWPNKVGFHDGTYHATFAQHGDRVLRLASSMREAPVVDDAGHIVGFLDEADISRAYLESMTKLELPPPSSHGAAVGR